MGWTNQPENNNNNKERECNCSIKIEDILLYLVFLNTEGK